MSEGSRHWNLLFACDAHLATPDERCALRGSEDGLRPDTDGRPPVVAMRSLPGVCRRRERDRARHAVPDWLSAPAGHGSAVSEPRSGTFVLLRASWCSMCKRSPLRSPSLRSNHCSTQTGCRRPQPAHCGVLRCRTQSLRLHRGRQMTRTSSRGSGPCGSITFSRNARYAWGAPRGRYRPYVSEIRRGDASVPTLRTDAVACAMPVSHAVIARPEIDYGPETFEGRALPAQDRDAAHTQTLRLWVASVTDSLNETVSPTTMTIALRANQLSISVSGLHTFPAVAGTCFGAGRRIFSDG